ncbi:hypothetical protein DSO57_1012975 [Entomophthora muscae]|uniref:Uncharacterized protein n=1 Tax=Entomophthora muscae TaxID=34485 RepID=A0ACC2TGF7_9FUNG|nr:hypothetical protein DSO57_1012975 [Entomophthora muscae]
MGLVVLAQQWTGNAFTIHGLWPGNCLTGGSPDGGCTGPRYPSLLPQVARDAALYQSMSTYWPSVDGKFWSNQWNKHGSCLSTVQSQCHGNDDPPNDIFRYFRMTLDLYGQYNATHEILQDSVPGEFYRVGHFENSLAEWQGSVTLHCTGNELSEVRIYLLGKANNQFLLHPAWKIGNCAGRIRLSPSDTPRRKPNPEFKHYLHDEL